MNFKEMDNERKIAAVMEGGRYSRAEAETTAAVVNL